MSTVNKFFPINVQNTNSISGTYDNVSLLVNANEETKGTTILKQVAINQNIDPSCSLAVNGNTKLIGRTDVSGSLYVNGTQITGGGSVGPDLSLNTLTIGNDVSGSIFLNGDVNIKPFNYTKKLLIDADLDVSRNTIFRSKLDSFGSTYVEKLTYSNLSSDIAITNWNAASPAYTSGGYYLQYTGSGTYTGLSGFIFSGTGYQVYIVYGIGTIFYFIDFPPGITTNQCFVLQTQQNQTINAKTINYVLNAGGYTFGFWMQSQVGGTGQFLDWDVYVKNSSNVVLGQVLNLAPSNSYPNWVFYTINFNLTTTTTVYFEFQSSSNSYIYGGYVCLVGLELTLNNSIIVTDTATSKTATISGAQTILNAVSVNDGISVNSGGLSVLGGINSSTTAGSGNTTMNTILGQTSNPVNNVAIGGAALQSGTTASQNVVIGTSAVPFATTISNNVAIGFNANLGTTTEKSVVIGSRQIVRGNNTVAIGNFDFIGTTQGAIGQNCVGIGSNILGANVNNGFGVLSTQDSVAIGNSSQYNCTDRFNNSIGVETLFNLNGRNGVTANGNNGRITQYNQAFGYRAGYNRQQYNNCTFIGAFADASVENLSNSVAIGHNCIVDLSNCIQLGSNGERIRISGDISGVTTINGQPYVSGGGGSVGTLSQVLTNGNNANGLGINNLGASNINGRVDISGNVFINNTTLYITRGSGSLPTDGTSRINYWNYATSVESNFISEAINASNLSIGEGTPNVNQTGTGYSNRIQTVSVGRGSHNQLTTGNYNTALGVNSGNKILRGSFNTCIGNNSGNGASAQSADMSYCSFFGHDTRPLFDNLSYATAIGAGASVGTSNTVSIGRSTDTVQITGTLNSSYSIFQNGMRQPYTYINATATVTLDQSAFGSLVYVHASSATQTINLPSIIPTNQNGAVVEIINYSSHQHTIGGGGGSIGGAYGSGASTQIINRGQRCVFILTAATWKCISVSGVPYSYIRYHDNSQTVGTGVVAALFNTAGASVDLGNTAWNLDTWNGARLGYNNTTGVFTNSTGFPMTIQVETYAVANPTSATRYIGILPSATRQASNTIWYSGAAGTSGVVYSNYTFYLGINETFNIQYQASAAGVTYGTTTVGANSNRIIITRIS